MSEITTSRFRRSATTEASSAADTLNAHTLSDPLGTDPVAAPIQARASATGLAEAAGAQLSDAGGSPLPESARSDFEHSHGADFSSVRIHTDDAAPSLGAEALTRGEHVHLPASRYDTESAAGREVLGHELAHVVQQREGRVAPTASGINADPGLEAEADHHGALAASGGQAQSVSAAAPATVSGLQFKGWKIDVFIDKITKMGLPGVCDALSAAWLTDLVEPDTDDTMGVDEKNVEKITLLKSLFGMIIQRSSYELGSKDLSLAFVHYFRDKGLDSKWFDKLTKSTLKTVYDDFWEYLNDDLDWDELSKKTETKKVQGKYDKLDESVLFGLVDDALEEPFTMATPFHGLVVINAFYGKYDESLNHQFAVRYDAKKKELSIFDQNGGLAAHAVSADDDISEAISSYVHKGYVKNPMRTKDEVSHSAQIEILLDFSS